MEEENAVVIPTPEPSVDTVTDTETTTGTTGTADYTEVLQSIANKLDYISGVEYHSAVNIQKIVDSYLTPMYTEMQTHTETLVEIKETVTENQTQLISLNGLLMVLVAFTVLEFCWSCMRQWRKNILGMGEE